MQAANVIQEVSMDLNDQVPGYEYTRWTVVQLQSYLHEALITVSRQVKDLFYDRVVVKLQAGAVWQSACTCTNIIRILGECNKDGDLLKYIRRSADIESNIWAGPVAGRCRVLSKYYTIVGYTTSSINRNEFRVTPPVPPGVNKYVLVECYKQPAAADTIETVPDEIVPIIKQWMLYRALAVDSENNPTIIELADKHKSTFMELLQAAVAQRELERLEDGDSIRTVRGPTSE